MKIISNMSFYLVMVVLYGSMSAFIAPDDRFAMNQFRAPYSLSEMLHDGLVFIQNSLDQIVTGGKEQSIHLLAVISEKLQDLENMYAQMYVKSGFHHIKRNERDFLQGLIDRIDLMIQQLENDDSYSPQDQEMIKKNINLLQNLKDQLNS